MRVIQTHASSATTFRPKILSLMIAVMIFPANAPANPTGPNIVNGTVNIDNSTPGLSNITNSPNAIINWQGFYVEQNEITRFIQQNSQSAVLNRVVGANPSQIMGAIAVQR